MRVKALKILCCICVFAFGIHTSQAQVSKRKSKKTKVVVKKTPRKTLVYKTNKPRVNVVRTVPKTTVVVNHNGVRLHYNSGLYYRYNRGRYIVVTPPIGIRIGVLPVGHTVIMIGGYRYYYYQGCYYTYIETTQEYEVIEAPQDAIVYTLPEDTEEVIIDGKTYFESNSVLYKVVVTPEGKAFQVVSVIED